MKQAHIPLLRAFDDLPFNIGRKTFIDYIKGNPNNTIDKNNLCELDSYGCLYMHGIGELNRLIDVLIEKNYLKYETIIGGYQVLKRTPEGGKEIYNKEFKYVEKSDIVVTRNHEVPFEISKVNDSDRKLFSQFDFFLSKYNEEQKKVIISLSKSILCVAGAGTGKTTVLTKRIEFLTKFRGVDSKKILAITFTKKAKEEMQKRLNSLGLSGVQVETFNSYCERVLRKHGDKIYSVDVKVASYRDKIQIVRRAMDKLSVSLDSISGDYFNKKQLRDKSLDDLFFVFVNDVFSIVDFYKNIEEDVKTFYELEKNPTRKRVSKIIFSIVKEVYSSLRKRGLRDFSDQIIDTLELYRKFPELIPKFEHVLIDEYQDLNLVQFEFVKLLKSNNVFAVGDPRQAIYGWRGSDIKYILNFPKEFEGCEVLSLNKNYRSRKEIVELFNKSIDVMKLEPLESARESIEFEKGKSCIYLFEQSNENLEKIFVAQAIKNSQTKRDEIFILARTNRVLDSMADVLSQQGIDFVIKSEEEYKTAEPTDKQVVLATIHSIKGMEASEVYLIGTNTLSFPNKVQDNFVLANVKNTWDYNKEEEELRLFYVALSRAKDKIVITYTGNLTKFVTSSMLKMFKVSKKNKSLFQFGSDVKTKKVVDSSNSVVLKNLLKEWRAKKADDLGLPSYMVINNTAIDDISFRRPVSKAELEVVNGLGPVKIAKYGDEILEIVNG